MSLGGFSSILIEGNFAHLPERHDTVFTTGNTLTVGFIVQGIKKMCAQEGRDLGRSTLLIVGATGDVGSGCARCLAPLVKRVLLSARNLERLRRLAEELHADGVEVEITTDLRQNGYPQFSAEADLVICAASLASPSLLLGRIAPDAIVCDAGYPKNLSPSAQMPGAKVFFGGLGQITGGLRFAPDFHGILNRHPFPDVVHGCLLEGMALALEGRFEPFSQGRGFITPERVGEIETIGRSWARSASRAIACCACCWWKRRRLQCASIPDFASSICIAAIRSRKRWPRWQRRASWRYDSTGCCAPRPGIQRSFASRAARGCPWSAQARP